MAKVSLIDLRDYPRDKYTHYWEIQVAKGNDDKWGWIVRFMPFQGAPSDDDLMHGDVASSEEAAREASQKWVLDNIDRFRCVADEPH